MRNMTNYQLNSALESKRSKRRRKRTIRMVLFTSVIFLTFFIGIKNIINKRNALAKNKISTTYAVSKEDVQNNKNNQESKMDKNINDNLNNDKNNSNNINNQAKDNKNSNNGIVMTVNEIWNKEDKRKIAFLTFDDGPSPYTPKILDILEKYNIKATFFVLGTSAKNYPEYLKREVVLGNSIGNHTYSHRIKYYGNYTPDAFVDDVRKCDYAIKEVLGQDFKTNLVRFPGGSFNHKSYKNALQEAGFKSIDWNVENGDARRLNVPKEELINNVKNDAEKHNKIVILMHDSATKETTVEALPDIIEYLKSQGFEFGIVSQNN
ncbi:Peptidoglycan-N-acetylglucosamine deacetylase [Clostridium liquoris]|jgi:peptidoglycan/xylan/chitin deacetylase (PgdA/CDA1 family)|uniref:Peptidoglycan-N-acetylglucosamine deacetylase n=1 Tax=Clostridium liquoris TaxID=1289519 RepID=A0A2T0B303_9CLOT|nr:polysaccharide deacetylase family protein [Clostridium liquoris]PRR78269.1 Peptidoglycan-N-acetylglucosamine deacetylase [Clostridium liquoris]